MIAEKAMPPQRAVMNKKGGAAIRYPRPLVFACLFQAFILFVLFVAPMADAEEIHQIPVAPPEYLEMKNPIDSAVIDEIFLKKAARLYKRKCRSCHGEKGDGKGSKAEFILIKPAAFSTPGYLEKRKDGQLFWILMNGSEGTEMEARGPGSRDNLSEDELWSLIIYIRRAFTR